MNDIKELKKEYETKIKLLDLFDSGYAEKVLVERRDGSLDLVSVFVEEDICAWRSVNFYYRVDGRSFTSSDWDIIRVVDENEFN